MATLVNPFLSGINIPDEYFCDRKEETEKMINWIQNGFNIVLKSPRRIGKSSLIKHLFHQEMIQNHYNTLFVDIYGTKDMIEFLREFQNAFLDAPFAKTKRGMRDVTELLRSLYFQMNLTPDGVPAGFRFGIGPGSDTKLPLREMFRFLENTAKPTIVVFDEFQAINDYPEKASAILRGYVQQMNNTRFIFSGSSQHLMNRMFEYPDEPFYRSATSLDLDIISSDAYCSFCREMFGKYGKSIEEDAILFAYCLFSGNTYDMQAVMKHTFARSNRRKTVSRDTVIQTIQDMLDGREQEFREVLSKLGNVKERRTLFCIAEEGIASGLTSAEIMKRYKLDNASSVQNALKVLSGDKLNLIRRIGKATYILRDRFFELWLARNNQVLKRKFDEAETRFKIERSYR